MTETPIEPTPEPEPAEDDTPMTLGEARKLRRESAALRSRLHAAEARLEAQAEELGGAAAVLEAMRLAEIKRVAGQVLVDPEDLLAHQPDVTAYFDAEFAGMVNADRVTEQAKKLATERPHLARPPQNTRPPTDRPLEGLRPAASAEEPAPAASWAAVIRPGPG